MTQVRLTPRHPLRTVDDPPHCERARIPLVYPPDNTAFIRPDQIGNRYGFDLIFVNCLLTSYNLALRIMTERKKRLLQPHAGLR